MLLTIKLWLPPSSQDSKEGGAHTSSRVTCPEAEDRLDPIRGLSCPPRKWLAIEPFVAAFLALAAILRYLQHRLSHTLCGARIIRHSFFRFDFLSAKEGDCSVTSSCLKKMFMWHWGLCRCCPPSSATRWDFQVYLHVTELLPVVFKAAACVQS